MQKLMKVNLLNLRDNQNTPPPELRKWTKVLVP